MANYGAERQPTVVSGATIDLNRVHVFSHVVEHGSFTAAAQQLGLPKSSVSRSVTALERALGVRLLQRTTRALSLTDAGRTYYQQVRPALASLSDSAAAVRDRGSEPTGRVRVSVPSDSQEIISRYVARFKKEHPRVQVDVSFSSRHVDLVAEGFDLALRAGALKDSSLVARKVMDGDLALYAAPSYLRRHKAPATPRDLEAHECIGMHSPTGRGTWTLTGPGGLETPVEVVFGVSCDHLQFAVRCAINGLGIVLAPEVIAGGFAKAELVRVLPQWRRVGVSVNIVSPSRAFEPLAVTLFKEGLFKEASRLSATRCASTLRGGELGDGRPRTSRQRR
jgi:DNA-binding transcriptional LysR family regulator